MKTSIALCLALTLQLCLSIPIIGNEEDTENLQSDSVPIALLLVVPPTSQLREDEIIPEEDITLIEDHQVKLLSDVDTSHEDNIKSLQEEPLSEVQVESNDIREDDVKEIIVDEPVPLKKPESESLTREDPESTILLEELPSTEEESPKIILEEISVRLVEEDQPREDDAAKTDGDSSAQRTTDEERPLERSYDYTQSKPNEHVVATFPEATANAMPILLNCAPKVETGHLAHSVPTYRNHDIENNTEDESISENSDVLDLNSPASIISLERKRRHLTKAGVSHYKVSDDFPEAFHGNHHRVSADYPQPNMFRMSTPDLL